MSFVPICDAPTLARIALVLDRAVPERLSSLVNALARVAPQPADSFETMREEFAALAAGLPSRHDVIVDRIDVNGISAELMTPPVSAGRMTLYLHGGAYTIGSIATIRSLASQYSRATRSRVITLDYRLAPEHPFPAALNDAATAFDWMRQFGGNDALIIAGDSAGGGLALVTALKLAHEGAGPDAVVAMSPWTDLALDLPVPEHGFEDPQAPRWLLKRSADVYLDGLPTSHPGASPVHADLSQLPPTLLQVGTAEPLLDDALNFGARAFDAGAPLRLECWKGMVHVWQAFAPRLTEGAMAMETADAWLTEVLDS